MVAAGCRYGPVRALADVTLTVQPGEHLAIVGPSGAGKSTLIALLNGSVRPNSGNVRVLGADLVSLTGRARRRVQARIGTVYQDFRLVDDLRVIHNVNAGKLGRWSTVRALRSLLRPVQLSRAAAALDRVGIAELIYARAGALSGGQRQRVAIARMLVQEPDLILADEPISNLDPVRGDAILALIQEVAAERGATLIVSLHAVEAARRRFPRLVGLRDGRVAFDAPSDDISTEDLDRLYRLPG